MTPRSSCGWPRHRPPSVRGSGGYQHGGCPRWARSTRGPTMRLPSCVTPPCTSQRRGFPRRPSPKGVWDPHGLWHCDNDGRWIPWCRVPVGAVLAGTSPGPWDCPRQIMFGQLRDLETSWIPARTLSPKQDLARENLLISQIPGFRVIARWYCSKPVKHKKIGLAVGGDLLGRQRS